MAEKNRETGKSCGTERSCGEQIPYLLKSYGVDVAFGMPGVHSLEFYRSLEEAGLRHVGVRHEQGAGFMADGHARASGKPGVATIISGPDVTNAATAVGQAYSDSGSNTGDHRSRDPARRHDVVRWQRRTTTNLRRRSQTCRIAQIDAAPDGAYRARHSLAQ